MIRRPISAALLLLAFGLTAAHAADVTLGPATSVSPSPSATGDVAAAAPATNLPRVELKLGRTEGLKVGDSVDVELRGSALPSGARLRPVTRLVDGYSVNEAGQLRLFKPGPLQLPALEIVDAAGTVIAETDPVAVELGSVLPEKKGEDGKPPPAEPPAGPEALQVPIPYQLGAALLLFGVLATGLYFLFRWAGRRFFRRAPVVGPKLTADTIALRRLSQVESEKWYEKGNAKRHFFEISEALKAYFSDRYAIDARESTTTELLERLAELQSARRLDDAELRSIRDCFTVLDLVKFTDYQPATAESVAQLEEARQIVVRTKEPPRLLTEESK